MRRYTVYVCAGCQRQASRAAEHSKRCPHRRFKWHPIKPVDVIPYADYSRVVNALLTKTGAKCTCPVPGDEHDSACPYHGDDGTRVSILRKS